MREGIQEFRGGLHRNADGSRLPDPTVTSKGRYSPDLPRRPCNSIRACPRTERDLDPFQQRQDTLQDWLLCQFFEKRKKRDFCFLCVSVGHPLWQFV